MAQLYLDLDELDRVFAGRWLWSAKRRNLAEFRRSDYLGPAGLPLAEAVRDCVARAGGDAAGRADPDAHASALCRLLFNPVSFYYCYAADGMTSTASSPRSPTPPGTSATLMCCRSPARSAHGARCVEFDKAFHVSPFMPMDRRYDWRFTAPGDDLRVHMEVRAMGRREFDATLLLRRRPLTRAACARVLWRYPLMTAQVIGAIHWQALRLWLKGNPSTTIRRCEARLE